MNKLRKEIAAFERFKHRQYLVRRIKFASKMKEKLKTTWLAASGDSGSPVFVWAYGSVVRQYCEEIARHLRSTEKCGVRS